MKKIVKIILVCMLVIIAISISAKEYAVGETFKTELKTTEDTLKVGQEFEVSINFSDITTQDGFTNIKGNIYYDENVLQYISNKEEFIENQVINNLENQMQSIKIYNNNDGSILFETEYLDSRKIKNFKLTFKVKEETNALNTKIKLEILEATNADKTDISGISNNATLDIYLDQNVEVEEVEDDNDSSIKDEREEIVKEGITNEAITEDIPHEIFTNRFLIIGIIAIVGIAVIAIIVIKNKSKKQL